MGVMADVMVCVEGAGGDQGFCPTGYRMQLEKAYLLSANDAQSFATLAQPFDPQVAGDFFNLALFFTLGVYLVALGLGSVLSLVKKA